MKTAQPSVSAPAIASSMRFVRALSGPRWAGPLPTGKRRPPMHMPASFLDTAFVRDLHR